MLAIELGDTRSGLASPRTDDELAEASGLDLDTVRAGLGWLADNGHVWAFGPDETGLPWRLIVVCEHPANLPIMVAVAERFGPGVVVADPRVRAVALGVLREAAAAEFTPA